MPEVIYCRCNLLRVLDTVVHIYKSEPDMLSRNPLVCVLCTL
jgi:hypothetical protein